MPLGTTESSILMKKVEQLSRIIDEDMATIDGACLPELARLSREVASPSTRKALEVCIHTIHREMLQRELFTRQMV